MNEYTSPPAIADSPRAPRRYLPGMGLDCLLPLYDPFTRLVGIQAAHQKLADQAELESEQRVLEIGCGTGNLCLLVKRMRPQLEVVGLDPDPKALARADRKARRAGLSLELDRGFADELPYPDASFDRVLSAFVFHHLEADLRLATLQEVVRVLQPGGSLHLLDLGGNSDDLHGLMARLFRHSRVMRDNWGRSHPNAHARGGPGRSRRGRPPHQAHWPPDVLPRSPGGVNGATPTREAPRPPAVLRVACSTASSHSGGTLERL
jgi:SAM-dependent methyltransferase